VGEPSLPAQLRNAQLLAASCNTSSLCHWDATRPGVKMDNSRFYDQAMESLSEAVKADDAKDYSKALELYLRGIDRLISFLRCECARCALGLPARVHALASDGGRAAVSTPALVAALRGARSSCAGET
jgi:hypothetical protein